MSKLNEQQYNKIKELLEEILNYIPPQLENERKMPDFSKNSSDNLKRIYNFLDEIDQKLASEEEEKNNRKYPQFRKEISENENLSIKVEEKISNKLWLFSKFFHNMQAISETKDKYQDIIKKLEKMRDTVKKDHIANYPYTDITEINYDKRLPKSKESTILQKISALFSAFFQKIGENFLPEMSQKSLIIMKDEVALCKIIMEKMDKLLGSSAEKPQISSINEPKSENYLKIINEQLNQLENILNLNNSKTNKSNIISKKEITPEFILERFEKLAKLRILTSGGKTEILFPSLSSQVYGRTISNKYELIHTNVELLAIDFNEQNISKEGFKDKHIVTRASVKETLSNILPRIGRFAKDIDQRIRS